MKSQFRSASFVKKGLIVSLLLLLALLPGYRALYAQCTTLVWSDEFNGTTLDQTKWAYTLGRGCDQPSGCGFGNGEEQSYTNLGKNIAVGGGNLTITAIFDNPEPGAAFSSAKIQTLGLKTFQYGKIESRMKLSSGQGAWPAFWMLAQSNNWPYTGEIDIMEAKHKNPTQVLGTVHHYNGHNTGQMTTPDLSAAFHTYAVEWEKDEIRWYFDGALYHRATPQTTGGAWPFNNTGNPFYLIYNLAVGGLGTPFTGNQAFNSADFPTNMQVDYVRVYSGTWNEEFNGDPFVYKGENNKLYSITAVAGAGYSWTVPAGATIASGQGTNQISVNFGTSAASGNVGVAITSGCTTQNYTKAVTVEEAFKVTTTLKDWDANNNMTFVSASGTLTQVVNPAGSTNVGKYVRNGGQLYDNIIHKNIAFGNASDFVTRRRRIRADIYTSAPVGTKVRIQLENAAKSTQTFPVGRHSVYEVKTTRQNAWETVEFEYVNSPDLGTGSTTVDQMAILFAVETNSSDTYYIDNLVIGTAGDLCPRILNQTLEDFQTNRNITFNSSTGTLSTVANPASGGINTSAQVGKYIRNSAELYDVLFYKNVTLNNVANFKNGKSVFKMQVYSSAPIGTAISLQLETSASTPSNYPTGRHSLYQGVTSVQNQWESIEFSYVSSLDALALDAQVNSIVFLYSPNTNNGSTYYFDNLITEAETCSNVAVTGVTVSPTAASIATATTQQLTATIAPANATNKTVSWASNNPSVATVNGSGLVTAVATGTATITVTTQDGLKTASSTITVTTGNVPVTGVTVTPATASIAVGATQQLTATVAPANATNKTVLWSSNNQSVATVNSSGLVSAIAAGNALITVTTQDGGKTASSTITVTSGAQNLALNKVVTTSSTESASYPGSLAVDGNGTTRWSSAFSDAQYIYVNLGASYSINRVKITWEAAYGKNYTVDVSADGASWTPIKTVTNNTTLVNDWTGLTGTGSYVRINGTARGTVYGYSIFELEVYGTSGCTPSAITPYLSVNGGTWQQTAMASLVAGGSITLGPQPGTGGSWSWTGPGGFTAATREITRTNIQTTQGGNYIATHTNSCGATSTQTFAITVTANPAPTVSLTSPASGATFTAGSNITITADAADTSPGTVTKVEFFYGANKIGEDVTSPYSIVWNAAPAGTHSLTAKATDNGNAVTTSAARSITVTGPAVCTQTSQFGHYTTEISSATSNPTLKFVPSTAGIGSPTCILYYSTATTGSYPGYVVTANTPYQITAAAGTTIYYYYTYSLSTGGEQNTSAYKKSFVVGSCSSGRVKTDAGLDAEDNEQISLFPNPANDELSVNLTTDFEGGTVRIVDAIGREHFYALQFVSGKLDVTSLTPGLYILQVKKEQRSASKRFTKE
jgi:uncharacterized protein YjdB/beta-glucanase (GH16 family)